VREEAVDQAEGVLLQLVGLEEGLEEAVHTLIVYLRRLI
jgi:hypothetical protein